MCNHRCTAATGCLNQYRFTDNALIHTFLHRQDTCDNDDDFTVGWKDELPPGVQGCLRPQKPANSFLRVKIQEIY